MKKMSVFLVVGLVALCIGSVSFAADATKACSGPGCKVLKVGPTEFQFDDIAVDAGGVVVAVNVKNTEKKVSYRFVDKSATLDDGAGTICQQPQVYVNGGKISPNVSIDVQVENGQSVRYMAKFEKCLLKKGAVNLSLPVFRSGDSPYMDNQTVSFLKIPVR